MEERFVNNEKVTGSIPVHGDEENYSLIYFLRARLLLAPFTKPTNTEIVVLTV